MSGLTQAEADTLMHIANSILFAARTAPKSGGQDKLVARLLTPEEKQRIAEGMREIGENPDQANFTRDAANVETADLALIFGTRPEPFGTNCRRCGFESCRKCIEANGLCAWNVIDLGIAMGSAVSRAADFRIDNRIFGRIGIVAESLGITQSKHSQGLLLSVSSKSPFFDRGSRVPVGNLQT